MTQIHSVAVGASNVSASSFYKTFVGMLLGLCNTFFLGILFLLAGILIILNLVIRKSAKMCQSHGRLVGKLVVITGANSGIGYETAIDLARRGATIILACRDIPLANAAKRKILEDYGEGRINHNGFNVQNSALTANSYYTSVKPNQVRYNLFNT